jgi:hypothetical protein
MADDNNPTITILTLQDALLSMASESWRFTRLFERLLIKLDAGEQSRYLGQMRWYVKKIDEALSQVNMRIVNIEGHPFDPGMAAIPLNIDDFNPDDSLFVDQMLEPIIMNNDGLLKSGTVVLKKMNP